MTTDHDAEIAALEQAHQLATMLIDDGSVGFAIPVSVQEIDESESGWPFRREWSMPFSDSMEEKK